VIQRQARAIGPCSFGSIGKTPVPRDATIHNRQTSKVFCGSANSKGWIY